MIAVADSSPLVVLANTGYIHLAPALFTRVVIPPEVAVEVAAPHRPEAVRKLMAVPPSWLKIRPAVKVEVIDALHPGESAAIALARELAADRLIIDERHGRRAASARQIQVVGTIGVLELAAEMKLIDLAEAFDAVKRTDFWISPGFLDERLIRFQKRSRNQDPT